VVPCDAVATDIAFAIYLVASYFQYLQVTVVLSGGVLGSEYIRDKVTSELLVWPKKQLSVANPVLSPVGGAILLWQTAFRHSVNCGVGGGRLLCSYR
jgi:hypothetical protein